MYFRLRENINGGGLGFGDEGKLIQYALSQSAYQISPLRDS